MLINTLGVLYIVFVLKEPKPRLKDGNDKELVVMLPETKSPEHASTTIEPVTHTTGNVCTNTIKDCAMVIVRKRGGHGRKIVCLVLIIVGLSQALEFGMIKISGDNTLV